MSEKEISWSRLSDRATRILAIRDHSSSELKQKLQQSGQHRFRGNKSQQTEIITEEQLENIVAWCQQQGWLDDSRFADRLIRGRVQKGYGPLRIQRDLRQKGITAEVAEQALAELEIDWRLLAVGQAERKFGSPLPTDWQEKVKVQRYLQSRGFFADDIHAVFGYFND